MNVLLKFWQKFAPERLLLFIRYLLQPAHYKVKREKVLNFYKKKDLAKVPNEIKDALQFLKYHKFSPLPYKWTLKYENFIPDVFQDNESKHFFITYQGKKLFFPKNFSQAKVIWGTRSILKEQDIQSPHLYLTENFQVDENSIIIDAGVAEGNFALSVVEKAKRLYLIECDQTWIETLKLTFSPWKDKVVFVNKYLSGTDSENTVKIDSLLPIDPNEKYFIKMDIEGYEIEALTGMNDLLRQCNNVKMDICTYHHPNDLQEIEKILKEVGFKWEVSNGYLLFFHEDEEPSFRKALVRAQKA